MVRVILYFNNKNADYKTIRVDYKYEQDYYFSKQPLFVNSESLPIGSRYEVKNGMNKQVYDTYHTYEYISFKYIFAVLSSAKSSSGKKQMRSLKLQLGGHTRDKSF